MAKQTLTSGNLTSDAYQVRDGKATVYLKGANWDGSQVQVEFKAPWGNDWIADKRFVYTEDTVDVIDVGDAASVRLVSSLGGGSESVDGDVTN